jgi:hypothetical protein
MLPPISSLDLIWSSPRPGDFTDYNNQNREDNGILKVDYHATERNSFNATYFAGDSNQIEEDLVH